MSVRQYFRQLRSDLGHSPLYIFSGAFALLFAFNYSIESIPIDGFMWLGPTHHFFANIWTNPSNSRPLFSFLHYIFVGPAVAVPGVDENTAAILGWRIGNWIVLVLSALFVYDACRRATRSSFQAYFAAFLVLTSTSYYLYLPHTGTQSHGYFVIFVSLWAALYLRDLPPNQRGRASIWIGILYGCLMLGKPQYNVLGTFWIFVLTLHFQTKGRGPWLPLLARISAIHFIPILGWFALLYLVSGKLHFYEVNSPTFSFTDFYRVEIAQFGFWSWVLRLPTKFLLELHLTLSDGFGAWSVVATYLSLAYLAIKRHPLALFLWIYFWFTASLLFAFRYLYSRHAEDLAPVLYVGLAILLDHLRRKFRARLFWPGFAVASIFWVLLNTSNWMMDPINKQCAQTGEIIEKSCWKNGGGRRDTNK